MDSESTDEQQCVIQVCLAAAAALLFLWVFVVQHDFTSKLSVLHCAAHYSTQLYSSALNTSDARLLYVGVFRWRALKWALAGVTAPAQPRVWERKQRTCLNNVKKKKMKGERVSQLFTSFPLGRRKALRQKTHEGAREREEREREEVGLLLDEM